MVAGGSWGGVPLCARGVAARSLPTITGWFAHAEQFQFQEQAFALRADARRFEMGTPALAGVYAALGGMQIVQEIGVPAIYERTRFLVEDVLARIERQGWRAQVAADPARRSAIVMLDIAQAQQIADELRAQRIIVSSYGGLLRLAPSFYTTVEENALVVHAIAELLTQRERPS